MKKLHKRYERCYSCNERIMAYFIVHIYLINRLKKSWINMEIVFIIIYHKLDAIVDIDNQL